MGGGVDGCGSKYIFTVAKCKKRTKFRGIKIWECLSRQQLMQVKYFCSQISGQIAVSKMVTA